MFSIIVARDLNNGIGYQGKLLIKSSEDMKYFKEKTTGKTIVMGRKTFESLPNKKPLQNRTNIVLTHSVSNFLGNYGLEPNIIISNDINLIIEKYKNVEDEVFIIGGEEIYNQFLPHCKNIYITELYGCFNSDSYFEFSHNPIHYDKYLIDSKIDSIIKLPMDFVKYVRKDL